ncbi:hypothetical protein A3D72_03415 [Candidatus Uhrbacteria bacterium RIFCSPHIGHO2_02_FULL_57_19]|uniref:Sodium/calcium exchanger membrane region domain-containing protein n=1 Tax=Candidatus Uhrbacteria bacterium RIFCSPHIGHO2_02_FULL_57_19 TaxID=1802391 RepID=A0A1F7U5P2_9BACT|nr:MAG: hypothetical protein A3D72_03415 [Candidatus Uhrbacteria bacterium RIFCSPHIGHO2_02_FULL_57_19]
MFVWIFTLVVSLTVLVVSSARLTRAAERLAFLLGLPGFVIGATVVAVGTSLPELFTAIAAALRGSTEIVAANVVGSNIFNATVVVGAAALFVRRLTLDNARRVVLLLATAVSLAFVISDGRVTRLEGLFSLLLGLISIRLLIGNAKKGMLERFLPRRGSVIAETLVIIGAAIVLAVSSVAAVESVVRLGASAGVSPSLIALFALAAGTSLPELAVSLSAARRRAFGISMGNVLGSNIINATLVIGLPAILSPLSVGPESLGNGLLFFLAASAILALLSAQKRVSHLEGWLLLGFYALFILLVFNL